MQAIPFTVHIFREREMYVAHAPKLDVSSCGSTETEARWNIQDAVKGFLETSGEMGTLTDVLEESGYRLEKGEWHAPEFVALDHLSVGVG
jgi:predicted RNase H-like HicB family nuclease